RRGRHLEIGVVRHPPVFRLEKLRRAAQLRQLPSCPVQVLRGVLGLVARLHRPDVIEDHPVYVQHLLVVLHLVGVLEEIADHPGVRQHQVEPFHRLGGTHGWLSVALAVDAGSTLAGGVFGAAASDTSLEYSTKAAPAPTRMMPTHSSGWAGLTPKCQGSSLTGCQNMLTTTLITGARPKMSGAM